MLLILYYSINNIIVVWTADRGQLRYNVNPNNASLKYLLPTVEKTLKQCRDFDAEHQCFVAGEEIRYCEPLTDAPGERHG